MHFSHNIEGQAQPWYYYLNRIRILFGEGIYIPLLWFMFHTHKNNYPHKYIFILAWIWIPLIVFSISLSKMPGYILIAAPAFFIINGWAIEEGLRIFRHSRKWYLPIFIFLWIALPIRYTIERIKPWKKPDQEREAYVERISKNFSDTDPKKTVLFNTPYPIQAMFYGEVTAYDYLPDSKRLNDLVDQDYQVYIDSKEKAACEKCLYISSE